MEECKYDNYTYFERYESENERCRKRLRELEEEEIEELERDEIS